MAQQHQINGSNVDHIGRPTWHDQVIGQALNGRPIIHRWRVHTWQANVITAAVFNTLYALEGASVSVTTTDYDDYNATNYKTYYGAILRAVRGRHVGPTFQDVELQFLVKI